jgi:hypothetical protein
MIFLPWKNDEPWKSKWYPLIWRVCSRIAGFIIPAIYLCVFILSSIFNTQDFLKGIYICVSVYYGVYCMLAFVSYRIKVLPLYKKQIRKYILLRDVLQKKTPEEV